MFALGFHYLNGWSMAAADGARKEQAEWPPHPDRVFMALAAAWFETGEDAEEGEVLRWLENLMPPEIAASDATTRTTVVSYVPVNDIRTGKLPKNNDLKELKKKGLALLPEHRVRQPRKFPAAIPADPIVYLIWQNIELGKFRKGLEQLATKVTHVGHSASFVHVWVEENIEIQATWKPSKEIAERRLRIPVAGRLNNLARTCNRTNVIEYSDLKTKADRLKGKEKKQINKIMEKRFGGKTPLSLHPVPSRWHGYSRPKKTDYTKEIGSVFSPQLIVLTITGKRLFLSTTLKLIQALREMVMNSCSQQPAPEWLSGQKPDGKPSIKPHLAFFPLPFVGDQHSDGRIMGLALALPRELNPYEAGKCLDNFLYHPETGLAREHRFFDSKWFECCAELENREHPPKNLDSHTWTRASYVWASVTPVVMNRHFNGKSKWEQAAESVIDACAHVGLPRPSKVLLHPVSAVKGAPHARQYPQLVRKKDGGPQSHSHAVIIFDEPVQGPVLIGAGRFRGYGLCRPMDKEGANHV